MPSTSTKQARVVEQPDTSFNLAMERSETSTFDFRDEDDREVLAAAKEAKANHAAQAADLDPPC